MDLLQAAEAGDAERCLALLQEPSIDINAKGTEDETVLHIALLKDLDEVATAILARPDFSERGAKMITKETALHIAAGTGKTSALRELLRTATKEELNARDCISYTALHSAVRYEHIECVSELLGRRDLNRDARDGHGNCALDQAEARSFSSKGRAIRLLLLGAGAPQKTHVVIVGDPQVPLGAENMPDDMKVALVVHQSLRCQEGKPMGDEARSESTADAACSGHASSSVDVAPQAGSSSEFAPQATQPQRQRRTRRGRGGQRRWAASQAQQTDDTEQPGWDVSIPDTSSELFFPKLS